MLQTSPVVPHRVTDHRSSRFVAPGLDDPLDVTSDRILSFDQPSYRSREDALRRSRSLLLGHRRPSVVQYRLSYSSAQWVSLSTARRFFRTRSRRSQPLTSWMVSLNILYHSLQSARQSKTAVLLLSIPVAHHVHSYTFGFHIHLLAHVVLDSSPMSASRSSSHCNLTTSAVR